MLAANIWRKLLGVDRATVIEPVDFDEAADAVVVHVRPRRPTKGRAGSVVLVRRAMTKGPGDGTGVPWISGSCAATCKPTRPE